MEGLVPEERRRVAVEEEIPEIPLALYESPIDLPAGWCGMAGAYVLLSEAYRRDADEAGAHGWPVIERRGSHLDLVNEPEQLARDLLVLTR